MNNKRIKLIKVLKFYNNNYYKFKFNNMINIYLVNRKQYIYRTLAYCFT